MNKSYTAYFYMPTMSPLYSNSTVLSWHQISPLDVWMYYSNWYAIGWEDREMISWALIGANCMKQGKRGGGGSSCDVRACQVKRLTSWWLTGSPRRPLGRQRVNSGKKEESERSCWNNAETHRVVRKDRCLHRKTHRASERGQTESSSESHWGMDTEQAPYESIHCEAHNTRVKLPVNQSSQLPSTTSRQEARPAQDRRHVTSCLAQPPRDCTASQPGTETLTVGSQMGSSDGFLAEHVWTSSLSLFSSDR